MLTREVLDQIRHLIRPLATRVANVAARAVVQMVDDSMKLQLLQLTVLQGEVIDGAEHFQSYGIAGVPPAGSEALVVFPGGDRSHPLVFAVTHRGSRPTGGEPGEMTVYNGLTGAKLMFTKDGDIVATPAAGRKMLVDDGSGAAALPTMADFNGIISIMNAAGTGAATALPAAVASYRAAHPTWPDGTKVLEGK